MARPESALVTRGVQIIRERLERGEHPRQADTAALLGIDRVTLSRACKRAGLTLPQGAPRKLTGAP